MLGSSFPTLCTPSPFAVGVVARSFSLLCPLGETCCSVASLVVAPSSVASLDLALVFSTVVQEVSVEEAFVNGKTVVSFCFVAAVGVSEVGLPLAFPARVVGFVLVPFDVVIAVVVLVLFDVMVSTVVALLFGGVVAAVVLLLFDVVVAVVVLVPFEVVVTVVEVLFDVVLAAVVVWLSLLDVLDDVVLPLLVPWLVAPVNGNVARLTVETTFGEVA